MKKNVGALNFNYLLLDFYKELNINEEELSVILMLDHLSEQGDTFVSSENMSLKMNLSTKKIDECMTNLYKKKYIEIDVINGITSVEPLKAILRSKYSKLVLAQAELAQDEELINLKTELCNLFAEYFERELTAVEESHIEEWVVNGVNKDNIINSLKDAKAKKKLTISFIETLIIARNNE